MDEYFLIGLLILVFFGLPIGLGLLLYFVPKKLGHPTTAKYLTSAYGIIVIVITFFILFEDKLFTKNNAKELVEEQGFILADQFNLIKNESTSAIGDYYHTFTLKISERDKQFAISKIKTDKNFKANDDSISKLMYQKAPDRYFGKKVIQNYETQRAFVREYFEPSGQEGYAPTFRRISFSKTENELIFEDIDE